MAKFIDKEFEQWNSRLIDHMLHFISVDLLLYLNSFSWSLLV